MARNKKKKYQKISKETSKIESFDKNNIDNKNLKNFKQKTTHGEKDEIQNNLFKNIRSENKNFIKENNPEENIKDRKNFKSRIINLLENKHVPIFSRFYKIFWVLKKNPKENKKMMYHILILFGGFFLVGIALLIASLSITGVINVDFGGSGGNDIFSGIFLAIAVIVGIII